MRPEQAAGPRVTRRQLLEFGVGAFVIGALPAALWRRQVVARRTMPVMGTFAELTVMHRDQAVAQMALDGAIDILQRVERTMSRFRPDSDVGRANSGAARDGVRIGRETAVVIAAALEWAESTGGRFDPAVGAMTELWDVGNRSIPPEIEAVRPLAGRGFWRDVDITVGTGGGTVRFTDPGVRLDLGGIAKGHGVDLAVQHLREQGVTNAIVNVGGDLHAMGGSPDGGPWRVGVRSPHDADAIATTMLVTDAAVCTSGDYAQSFEWQGKSFHHLIDPQTGAPRLSVQHSVTVQASNCRDADAAATAAFGMSEDEAARLVNRRLTEAVVTSLG